MIENLKIGDVVHLVSDIKLKWPMTIVKQYNKTEFQVTWLTKLGNRKYNAYPVEALKRGK